MPATFTPASSDATCRRSSRPSNRSAASTSNLSRWSWATASALASVSSTTTPKQLGADRIIDAVAASKLYGTPVIIVDFGTATVFDAVNEAGDYLGGAIAPGIGIASEALFSRAAMLYRVQLERPPVAIGKNTIHAMQSGILFGYVGLVEGVVQRFKNELSGSPKVIATGGLASLIAGETDCIDIVNGDLTLTGLRLIYELNAEA